VPKNHKTNCQCGVCRCTRGEDVSWKRRPHTEAHKLKIGLAFKNHKEDCMCGVCKRRRGISQNRMYCPMSEEHRKKISLALRGVHSSPQTEFKSYNKGVDSSNWKGGITKINKWIRAIELNKNWTVSVFKRDDYTCQSCGKRGCGLAAHHITPFHILLKEFLSMYSQFSPIDDTETLVRLAESYEPFWDVRNGRTLCYDCHDMIPKQGGRPCA